MQRSPTSPHTRFFTSLKHLEKRLKLENHPPVPPPPPPPPPPPQEIIINNNTQQTDSLGTPIYINCNNSNSANTSVSHVSESEAPQEFLSKSPDFPSTHHDSPHEKQPELHEIVDRAEERSDLDDDEIEMLMRLLNLGDERERVNNSNVGCDDGFYRKIVGAKGPKSVKEVERLEKWIEHFLNGGGKKKKEPFVLAHLLLGKAAFVHSGGDDCGGFGGFNFPSTIDEFLRND